MTYERVAVLADIHGNLPALEAVLADVDKAGVDLVVLNGDLADGPFPVETLERLEALGDRASWLRGNGDRWLVAAREGRYRHADPATDDMIHSYAAAPKAPNAQLILYPRSGHGFLFQHHAWFARNVHQFLGGA